MNKNTPLVLGFLSILFSISCTSKYESKNLNAHTSPINNEKKEENTINFTSNKKTIHVLVALCDNKYQGIVPVPPKIGNGQNPDSNLYWGAGYGIRTYFKKSVEWNFLKSEKLDSIKMERLIFQNSKDKNYYLVADAYNGKHIKTCTKDFLYSLSGELKDTLIINKDTLGIYGNSVLVSYIGHDGLMDFQLSESFPSIDKKNRDFIILACFSKKYFSPYLNANSYLSPILWTTHLMAPEAYTLHNALTGYINNESNEEIRNRAALAYSKYQKCSYKASKNLLVSGW